METTMCGLCLARNIRMQVIENTDLQLVYNKLTENMFAAEEGPLLACFICCARLKRTHQLMMICFQSQKILTRKLHGFEVKHQLKNCHLTALSITSVSQISVDGADSQHSAFCNVNKVKMEPSDDYEEIKTKPEYGILQIKLETEESEVPSLNLELNEDRTQVNSELPCCETELLITSEDIQLPDIYEIQVKRSNKSHSAAKPYKCQMCHLSFSKKVLLTNHIRKHTDEKPFKCDTCPSRFRRKGDLRYHVRIHTGEKPFQCHICRSRFKGNTDLRRHLYIHTGERPHTCHICQNTFRRSSHLKRHMLMHTGEKPFACDLCHKRFTEKSGLKTHARTHERLHKGSVPFHAA